ncbi:MAG: CHAT domain-containing protein [Gammaproteobacteria bacterium]
MDDIRWTRDGERIFPSQSTPVAGGIRFSFFGLASSAAEFLAQSQGGGTVFSLRIEPVKLNASLQAALQAMSERRFEQALLTIKTALPTANPLDVPRLLRTRARIYARLHQRAASHVNYRTAIAASNAVGDLSTLMLSAVALQFSLRQDIGDLDDAQAALELIDSSDRRHAETAYLLDYHKAMIAYRRGDARAHLQMMTTAATQATRFAWTHRTLRADTRLAMQWQDLGRQNRAIETLEKWRDRLPDDFPGMHQGIYWTNLGWAYWLALEAGETVPDPLPVMRRALALALEHSPVTERINAHINLGLALWRDGQLDAAADALRASRQYAVAPATHVHYWSIDLEARIAAALGNSQMAIALYDQLLSLANAGVAPVTAWRALVRRANVRIQLGDVEAALLDFEQAEELLDEQVVNVPVHAGRESLLATRRLATRQHLALLLNRDENEKALALWHRSHARSLRLTHVAASAPNMSDEQRQRWATLSQRYQSLRAELAQEQINSWTLSSEQLAALETRAVRTMARTKAILDEALSSLPATEHQTSPSLTQDDHPLVAFARASDGWVVFVQDSANVNAVRPDCENMGSTAIAQCLLDAANPIMPDSSAIRLLAERSLLDADWPALRVGKEPWIERTALIHSAALPASPGATRSQGHALLVGDPSGNLRAARHEVEHIARIIGDAPGWAGTSISGDQATASAVREQLKGTTLLHYAGHASYGDELGWESELHLAGGSKLGVGDLLTIDHAPEVVVLSGCETAARPGIKTASMGLANAFLAAGSQSVIATSRAVDDQTARAITTAFYQHWFDGQPIEQALRSAQRDVKETQSGADWSAFRLIQP